MQAADSYLTPAGVKSSYCTRKQVCAARSGQAPEPAHADMDLDCVKEEEEGARNKVRT